MAKKKDKELKIIEKVLKNDLAKFGAKLLNPTETHPFRLEIKSESSDRLYVVSFRNTQLKRFECSCPGWTFSKGSNKKCKHLKAIQKILEKRLPPELLTGQMNVKLLEFSPNKAKGNGPTKKKESNKGIKVGRLRLPEKKIITLLWEKSDGLTLEQISKKLDLDKKEVAGLLSALQDFRCVVNHKGKKWRILCLSLRPKMIVAFPGVSGSLKDALKFFDKKRGAARVFASYKTYSGKRGGKESWEEAANILANTHDPTKKSLETLDFRELPSLAELKRRYRKLMKTYHPDNKKTGSLKKSQLINKSYEKILKIVS